MGFWSDVGNFFTGGGSVDPRQAEEDRARNLDLYERAKQHQAPGEVRFDLDPQARGFSSAQIQAPDKVYADKVFAPDMGDAERVQAAQIDATERVTAPKLGDVATAGAGVVNAAQIDTSRGDEVRGQAMDLAQGLRQAASGVGPSVAESGYLAKQDAIKRQVGGLAARARGSDRAAANLEAMRMASDLGRQAALDAATIRAGEVQTARGQLGSVLDSTRGQDTSTATEAARLRQGAATTTAELGTRVGEGNRDARNQFTLEGGRMRLAADTTSATAANARALEAARLKQAADTTSATAANDRTSEAARMKLAAATTTAGNNLTAQSQNQTTGAAIARDQAGLDQEAARLRAEAENRRAEEIARGKLTAATTNQGSQARATEFSTEAAMRASGQASQDTATKLGVQQDNSKRRSEAAQKLVQGGTTAAIAAMSDMRAKEDVEKVSADAAERLARSLDVIKFRYKNDPQGKEHVGVSAQQLEKDPLGRKLVEEGDDGLKRVDYGALAPLMMLAATKAKREAARG